MRILFIGDIVGESGLLYLEQNISRIRQENKINLIIVNAENITNGRGLRKKDYDRIMRMGVFAITMGNHTFSQRDIKNYIKDDSIKGEGSRVFELGDCTIRVTNVLGQVFMKEEVIPPYEAISDLLMNDTSDIHIIDLHAEANGEKQSLAHAFKGEVTAILGTHTHVQTRDAQILDKKTAYISDVGMCGDKNGILGFEEESVIAKQLLKKNVVMSLNDDAPYVFSAVVITVDDYLFTPTKITPIYIEKGE